MKPSTLPAILSLQPLANLNKISLMGIKILELNNLVPVGTTSGKLLLWASFLSEANGVPET